MSHSLLFLAYFFPPRGGAGVQRSVKFAKYLPQFGWRPLVVANGGAVDNVSAVRDASLLADLPSDAIVGYTELSPLDLRRQQQSQSRWRRLLTATDPMGWWARPAARLGMELARQYKPSAIFVTMSPFTAAEAGIRLKHGLSLPLILDLRDPWALDETRIYPTRWHARRDWNAMGRAFAAADLVIMNTPQAAAAAIEEFGEARGRSAFAMGKTPRIISITNGYDADDFGRGQLQPPPADVLRIVHNGMFHCELAGIWDQVFAGQGLVNRFKYPRRPINLWTRTPRYLLEAMQRVISQGAIPADKIEFVLVGELSAGDIAMINASPVSRCVRMLGYQSHGDSVKQVEAADVLFLPLHTPIDGGPALIVPGKAYEYLGSGRSILAMGPPGDMRTFVQSTQSGVAIAGDDVGRGADALVRFYRAKMAKQPLAIPDRTPIADFERRALTGRLAAELDNLLSRQSTIDNRQSKIEDS